MGIVFSYAVMGGMKGITYTQVAQYCILIFAYMIPAIFISIMLTGHWIPQLGFGAEMADGSGPLLAKLDGLHKELGFAAYTEGTKSKLDVAFITGALMVGTAGLPHVIIRFFTVPKVEDARWSARYALLFIAILYTTAPAIAAFARTNLIESIHQKDYKEAPAWFHNWEATGLVGWMDKNQDGKIQYGPGKPFEGTPAPIRDENAVFATGASGERALSNKPTDNGNELFVDRDIMVLANPEIAKLPDWIVALVAAGALAAALSTAAGLLLVISTAVSHDLLKKSFKPDISEKMELAYARIAAGVAVVVAGYFGINPPGFVAQVVAFAFGLAASSFFPVILLGIFTKRMNKQGAIAGMLCGIIFTSSYILYFKFMHPELNNADHWLFGISPEGIGFLGMFVNFAVAIPVSMMTPKPPQEVVELVERIRIPAGAEPGKEIEM